MGNFIVNGATELPGLKTDAQEPTGAAGEWAGADANKLREALLDVRTHLAPTGAWIDLTCDIARAGGSAALTFEQYRDSPFSTYFMRNDQSDTLYLTFQMPHGWVVGSQVSPHIHIVPMANPAVTQAVYFTGSYAWSRIGSELPAAVGWTDFSATHNVGTTDAFTQSIVSLFSSSPSNMGLSAILNIVVRRDGTDNNDTYNTSKSPGTGAANLCALSIDAHVMVNRPGSANEASG
jgi:hypothetical protein